MGIDEDNTDYKNQNIQKATTNPQQNNSLFLIDSGENFNDTYNQRTAKSSNEIDLSAVGTKSKISYDIADSVEDYKDLDNQRAEKLPIDMGLSLMDKTPMRLGVSTSAYPSKGLSMIDSDNCKSTMLLKEKCIDVETNKKRRVDSDEASWILNYRKPAKSSSSNGISIIDSENLDDSSNDNQFTTHPQAKRSRSVYDSDNLKNNRFCTPEILTNSTNEQESMDIDDVISNEQQTNEESEREEEGKVINAQSGSSAQETDESEKMRILLSNFTDEQYDRYEKYRRSAFPKMKIKKFMESITGHSVSQNVVIAMAGIAKSFVGDIIEKSLDIQEQQGGPQGPVHPRQIREAVRQLRRQGKIPCSNDDFSKVNENLPDV